METKLFTNPPLKFREVNSHAWKGHFHNRLQVCEGLTEDLAELWLSEYRGLDKRNRFEEK